MSDIVTGGPMCLRFIEHDLMENCKYEWTISDFQQKMLNQPLVPTECVLVFNSGTTLHQGTKWSLTLQQQTSEPENEPYIFLILGKDSTIEWDGDMSWFMYVEFTNSDRNIKLCALDKNRCSLTTQDRMHFKLISIAELGPFVRDDGSLHILFWFTHIVRQPVRDFDYEVNLKHHREFPLMQSALNDLSKIYSEGSYSDFEMKTTDGTSFKVHRCILAGRSPVFSRMFATDMIESTTNSVTEPFVSPKVLDGFLNFIYSGNVEIERWTPPELSLLHQMMDKYLVSNHDIFFDTRLMDACSAANAVDLLELATIHKWEKAIVGLKEYIELNGISPRSSIDSGSD